MELQQSVVKGSGEGGRVNLFEERAKIPQGRRYFLCIMKIELYFNATGWKVSEQRAVGWEV